MTEPIGTEQLRDRTEEHVICAARNDAAYALAMAQRPEVSRDELLTLIEKLAGAVREVAHVAEMRGERLSEPSYAPAARALETALREALSQR
ncbi:hypothetical protein [Streptomyces sp. GbtcB6]|uniref:hypothetical protein n=1 Tax=Streptomyces sp. GbtcB6 TaxID=2824751 RepID=UPI001C2FB8CC|nr:hypothetical protein [Streptomyces sp. GbtcB6]